MSTIGSLPPQAGSPLRPQKPADRAGTKSSPDKNSAVVSARSSSTADEMDKVQLEGREKIAAAQEYLARTQREIEQMRDYAQRQYDEQSSMESVRQEDALEQQRNKGYEKMRELQRAQTAELEKVRKKGEEQLETTKEHFQNAVLQTEKRGETDLQKIQLKYFNEVENEKALSTATLAETRAQQANRYQATRDDRELKLAEASEAYRKEFERTRQNAVQAAEQAEQSYKDRLDRTKQLQDSSIQRINEKAVSQLREISQDTARKIAAYSARQDDPFYKLMDMDIRLRENDDSIVLVGRIPLHEQGHISVSVKNQNQLVVSGFRRNEEKLETGPGSAKATSSFQSFSQTIPLPAPVDAKHLAKHFEDDRLIITIPKLTMGFDKPQYQAPRPEKARVERPKFPDNIPLAKAVDTTPVTDPKKGSRPLG